MAQGWWVLGSLSSLLLFGIFFLLLFNYISNSINAVDFKVSQSLDFSEIPSTSYYGMKLIRLAGFTVEQQNGALVEEVSFNVTYLNIGGVRASDLLYSNLIIAYVRIVSGTPDNPTLAPTVKRIPYSYYPSSPRWFVKSVYNEVIDPLDLLSERGAWDSGETLSLVVEFAQDDQPYFDPNAGVGYFYILLDLPTGACEVMVVK